VTCFAIKKKKKKRMIATIKKVETVTNSERKYEREKAPIKVSCQCDVKREEIRKNRESIPEIA